MAKGGGSLSARKPGAGGFSIDVQIDYAKGSAEFKQARKEVNTRLRDAVMLAGTRSVLPEMRGRFPKRSGRMARSLYVKRDRQDVVIGSSLRGQMNRAVGWVDFGGRRPQDSRVRAGPHVIVGTLNRKQPQIQREALRGVMRAFDGFDHFP